MEIYKKEEDKNSIIQLPDVCLEIIISILELPELLSFRLTCKRINALCIQHGKPFTRSVVSVALDATHRTLLTLQYVHERFETTECGFLGQALIYKREYCAAYKEIIRLRNRLSTRCLERMMQNSSNPDW